MFFLRRTWAEINISALKKNINTIKSFSGDKEIIAVVKANAYGHGVGIIAPAIWNTGLRYFAVSNINEALELKEILPEAEIIIFGYVKTEVSADYDFIYTAGSVEYALAINEKALQKNKKIRVHIKLDTGMSRVGIDSEEELERILSLPGLQCEGVYTHFAASDSLDDDDIKYTTAQQEKLYDVVKERKIKTHSQNSGGIILHKDFPGDFVRAGIALYGYSPNPKTRCNAGLCPVLTLKSEVWQVKNIKKGAWVGYGGTYRCEREIRAAVVPVGYADGYSRAHSGQGSVMIRGEEAGILGRVSMDQIVVDVTGITGVKPGDEVIVYSHLAPYTHVDNIAERLGTISYEVLCGISARVERIASDDFD